MRAYHLFFVLVAIVGLVLGYALWNTGFLKPVVIEQKSVGPAILIYRHVIGPYHNLNQEFQKMESDFSTQKYSCKKTFGLYYDNPDTQEHERLRADIGCFAEAPPAQKMEGYEIKDFPSHEALVGTFRGAPWLTAFKVYRALSRQAHEKGLQIKQGPVLEVYEPSQEGFKTEVYFQIAH